ncbi:unnamed protein product [Scytosiphon promiscuus]
MRGGHNSSRGGRRSSMRMRVSGGTRTSEERAAQPPVSAGTPLDQVHVVGASAVGLRFSHRGAGGVQELDLGAVFRKHELSSALHQVLVATKVVTNDGIARVHLRNGAWCRIIRALLDGVLETIGDEFGYRDPASLPREQGVLDTWTQLEQVEHKAGPVMVGDTGSGDAGPVTPKDIVGVDPHANPRPLGLTDARCTFSALPDRDALAREAEGVVSAAREWRGMGLSLAGPERAQSRNTRAMAASGESPSSCFSAGGGGGWGGEYDGGFEERSPTSPASPVPPPSAGRAIAGEEDLPNSRMSLPCSRSG